MFGRPRQKTEKSGFTKLFRLMAVPRPQQPKEWTPPQNSDGSFDKEQYEKNLYEQGFIVPSKWDQADLTKFPNIMADLAILEKYLLPAFWDLNQKSSYYQSRYYYYQRIFLVAALLTTLISVLNSFIYAIGGAFEGGAQLGTFPFTEFPIVVDSGLLNLFLGICTAIISARASYYTLLANYGEPRQRWAQYRRLTEELRIIYFKYLAHLGKFNSNQRVQELRLQVLNVRQKEQQDG